MGTEEITAIWLHWHALSHIFQYLWADGTVNVTFVFWQGLHCHFNTHPHARTYRATIKWALPVCYTWFLFSLWTVMAVGFPFSGTHVERWYVWILNRKPQRIPNWEHWVMLVEVLFLLFTLPRHIFSPYQRDLRTVKQCSSCFEE